MYKYNVLPSSSFGFICRTCLLHNELFLIDEVSWEGVALKEIIDNWTSLEVKQFERLPKQMCRSCIKLMYQTYHFLSRCRHSERVLKHILSQDPKEYQNDLEDCEVLNAEHMNKFLDGICKIAPDADNIERIIKGSGNISNIPNVANDNSQSGSDSPDSANNSIISDNDNRVKIKTETTYEEEMLYEGEAESNILHEIQSIKSDISKIRADNSVSLLPNEKDSQYKCTTCEASFDSQEELKVHRLDIHKKYFKFKCQYCGTKYQSASQLEAHTRVHTGEKPYRCSTCGKSFSFKCVWKRHIVRHLKEKPHRCRYCQKAFTRKYILDQHERKHTGERLVCSLCKMEFNAPKRLRLHEKTAHPVIRNVPSSLTENGYQCDICGKILQSEKTLYAHVLLHGPKNFQCSVCGKCFTTNERLELHLRMTHQSTMYSCHLCDNKYRQKTGLIGHLESQHEAKIYFCEKCGKQFVFKGSLNQHMRLHTGDPKYQCKQCFQICVNRRRLEAHMRIHTGEKPFACEVCGKSFAEKANLHNHKKIHVKDKSYACNVCEKVFTAFEELKAHIGEHI